MSDDDQTFDPHRELIDYAARLNAMSRPRLFARPFYDMMSGGLVWTDETRRDTPVHVIWALRSFWAYRTSLMLSQSHEEQVQVSYWWQFGQAHFPNWVGFRPERRRPTAKLLRIYRMGDVSLRKCLRDLEREAT